MNIEKLATPVPRSDLSDLCSLLSECVRAGASIGFLNPAGAGETEAYWRKVAGEMAADGRMILVAREGSAGPILGSAQLAFESKANGRHRAEVQKVMVLPRQRRRGIARDLMAAVEAAALGRGVSLLVLDTSEGEGGARAFYEALGYTYAGGIPGYAVDPDGTPAKNAIFYKALK